MGIVTTAPFAAATAAISVLFALTGNGESADGVILLDDVRTNAQTRFSQADLDQNGSLDTDEFVALEIVTAELAHLNGFIRVETNTDTREITLPITAPTAIAPGARDLVEATAMNSFFEIAGDDGAITLAEFVDAAASDFAQADANNNGQLGARELYTFARMEARMTLIES